MRTYVISDIHGQYKAYLKMLELIGFKDEDFMYVLGDVIDRGPDGISIIKDIMSRDNADMILGNHEFMLINAVNYLKSKESEKGKVKRSDDGLTPFELWTHPCNGGEGTCLEYINLPSEQQDKIEEYLKSRSLIKRVCINDKMYHLSHSFSVPKTFGRTLKFSRASYKTAETIVWESLFDRPCDSPLGEKEFAYKDDIYIVGHIFTQRLGQMDEEGKGSVFMSDNYRGYNVIDIDCGMALNSRSSRLACMCLETGEIFYVPLLDD